MTAPDDDRELLMHAAFDGELDAARAIEVERRLAADPAAAAEYARLEALRRAIRAHAPRESAPEGLRSRILAAAGQGGAPEARRGPGRPSWGAVASMIAATIVVTAGLARLTSTPSGPAGAGAEVAAIVAGHMRAQVSGRPVDVASSDRHTVKPWLAAKLPVATIVPDLSAEGFDLIGARLEIVAGAAAPTLVYQRRNHIVSVTESPSDGSPFPAAPRRVVANGYPVVIWKDTGHAYAAVSDLSAAELDAFVAALRAAVAKETDNRGG